MLQEKQLLQMFKDMIALDTTNPEGNEVLMTDYISRILQFYKIPYEIIEPAKNRRNIVASIGPDSNKKPILLISHLDVVSCEGQSWKYPPFSAEEADNFIYGRGTMDTKHLTAMQLAAFLRTSQAPLDRRIYFIASADEEQGSTHGMPKIVEQYEKAFTNGLVINEGGGFYIENQGKPYYICTVGEKGRCDVHVSIRGDSGPSSFISRNTAISKFSKLLEKLSSFNFPFCENEVYRRYIQTIGHEIDKPFLEKFKEYNSRDAIILKSYDIGSQINALPHHIEFDFSLQLLPGRNKQDAQNMLDEIFSTVEAKYEITDFVPGFSSSCDNKLFKSLDELVKVHYGNAEILPVFALGRTDGRFLGPLPADVYGFSPVTSAVPFEEVLTLVHQANERIDRESIIKGADFFTELIIKMGCEHEE